MKLIQIYNTFEGDNIKCGFPTKRSLLDFWKKTTAIHNENYDVTIYTDSVGYEVIKDVLPVNIEVIDFENIDDRYYSIGKLQVYKLQTEPFIMVDPDAVLYDKLESLQEDIYLERFRSGIFGKYLKEYNLKPIDKLPGIPCTGLEGFKDPNKAIEYADQVLNKIKNSFIREVDFDALWHVEEITLANYIEDNGLTYNVFNHYLHLQGGLKK